MPNPECGPVFGCCSYSLSCNRCRLKLQPVDIEEFLELENMSPEGQS
jgi:hypothetical protein